MTSRVVELGGGAWCIVRLGEGGGWVPLMGYCSEAGSSSAWPVKAS